MNFLRQHKSLLFLAFVFNVQMTSQSAHAHFIWLAPGQGESSNVVEVCFGEEATPDDPDMLKYVSGMKAWIVLDGNKAEELKLNKSEESLTVKLSSAQSKGIVVATHDLGVMDRGDRKFRLKYYAKTGPASNSSNWQSINCSKQLRFDVIPEKTSQGILVHVLFNGKAVEGSEVNASGPGLDAFEGVTGESGTVLIPVKESGLFSIRAKHVEAEPGALEGKEYPETRHYVTLALRVQSDSSQALGQNLQPIKQPVTSFGGAILNGNLYVYGGHTGGAHSYSHKEQGHTLEQLNLKTGKWSTITEGPHLQGLALVSDGKQLYRIGGFTAKNAEGEDHDLWSQDSVSAFDLTKNTWRELPPLPEPRSSFDAAVLNGKIYVVGGWAMAGEADSIWHQTAWVLDPNTASPKWSKLPTPPFQRRALALAAFKGKIYAIGGMQMEGGPTRKVDIFDPATGQWVDGPEIIGEDGMTGFGASAFATGGNLYATTIKGDLQRLTQDGTSWEILRQTPTPRFFHRMLPVDENHLLVVGGASMEIGKYDEVEILEVE